MNDDEQVSDDQTAAAQVSRVWRHERQPRREVEEAMNECATRAAVVASRQAKAEATETARRRVKQVFHRIKHWLRIEGCRNDCMWIDEHLWHVVYCVECGAVVMMFRAPAWMEGHNG